MVNKIYSRRISFKLKIKDKWYSTYWYKCNIDELPYDLKNFFDYLIKMFNTDELFIKIERRDNNVPKVDKKSNEEANE